jgi:hypothetical protein
VSFDERNPAVSYRTKRVWASPTNELDVTIYTIDDVPDGSGIAPHASVALPLATVEPPLWIPLPNGGRRRPRVFPIGHPRGGPLSISIENNRLDDIRSRNGAAWPRFLHYKAATEPGRIPPRASWGASSAAAG